MYDSHLKRISARPGEKLQVFLHERIIQKFLERVEPAFTIREVLEVGPGGGRVSVQLISKGFKYVSIEPTKSMAFATQQRIKKYISSDFKLENYSERLPAVNTSLLDRFDAVFLIHVLEHAANPYEGHQWLSSIEKTLRPGGYLFLLCPDYTSYKADFYNVDWSHSFPTTVSNTKEIVCDAGFVDIYSNGIRGWNLNSINKTLLALLLMIFPIKAINVVAQKLTGVEKFGSGFASAFLYRNVFVVGRKPEKTV
jgi:SAM-dependent methyltransferase